MFVDFESEHYACMCARVCGRTHSVCVCACVCAQVCLYIIADDSQDKCLLSMTDRCESDTVLPAQADTSCFFTLDQGSLQCEFDTCRCSAPLSSEKFTHTKKRVFSSCMWQLLHPEFLMYDTSLIDFRKGIIKRVICYI